MTSLSIFRTVFFFFNGHGLLDVTTGETCGGRACLREEASCIHDICVCHEDAGDGNLNCYQESGFRVDVTNDPLIRGYDNNSVELSVPCRYLLTHAVTEYKDIGRNVFGSCEFMINVFHKKTLGKFYVGGFDVAIRVEYNNGSRYEMSFRKYGQVGATKHNFFNNATNHAFLPNGPLQNDVINCHDPNNSLRIQCKTNQETNLHIIEVRECGFSFIFRPYDVKHRRRQKLMPGISVEFHHAHHPSFHSEDRVLALPPAACSGFTIHSIEIPGLDKIGTMMHRAFMSGIPQTHPDPNPSCSAAKDCLTACSTLSQLQAAFSNCLWILRSPRFIRCYDHSESGVYIQGLFNTCTDIFCTGTKTCHDVIALIDRKDCLGVPRYPDMTLFIRKCI